MCPRRRPDPRMTSSRTRLLFFSAALAGSVTLGGTAHAQRSAADIESARQLYQQGILLRDKGDLKGALEKLRAAHALGNTPITGADLCKVHALLDQPVEAREVCLGVGRIPPLSGETSRSQEARSDAARIAEEQKARMAVLLLHVTGVPAGREPTVTVDGATVPVAALGQGRALDPGRHEIAARVGSGSEARSAFTLAPGEKKEITLPVQAPPVEAAAEPATTPPPGREMPPPPPKKSNGVATAGFVVAGVGVGLGAVAGLVAMSKKSDLETACPDKQCGTEQHGALDSARGWGNVSTAGFVIGGVGAAVGIVAVLAAPRSSGARPSGSTPRPGAVATLTPELGPGGVGIHGTF
ncbi:MAG: hypothetical protein JWP97_2029 [Labilithrix sp.]|nr:hypothetical protein [Labilithrix sp.]